IDTIKFNKATFIYPDTGIQAISDLSFTINKGEKVAIIGKTGSGKSTIAELLLRNYDIESGSISINQHNIKQIDLHEYRGKIGYTPQDVFLFSDTIKNNIVFANQIAENEEILLEKAIQFAKVTHVHHDIMLLKQQYNTIVGERGVMLSGGQKQRISIARSLFNNPEFVLLDDCLSAVDAKTEKTILHNLQASLKDKTVLFITHRVSAIMHFDKILVIDEGKLVEQGRHEELLRNKSIYYDIYQLQRQKNDLKNSNM
ncbi:MAG TPA: ATP-binding cassette domain-containing protein, partial [Chitinophagales bacterium]|nr:ATP-binding cassette domain-containing protein [Chitinophagales bacterium]